MMLRSFLLLMMLALATSPAHAADSRVFPPMNEDDCASAGSRYLSWFNNADGTRCVSGQNIFKNALPACRLGEYVTLEGSAFVCKTVPTCSTNELLSFNGMTFECRNTDIPTCGSNQILTFNGTSYSCVNRSRNLPTCGAQQFLTYNGTAYQCITIQPLTLPSCGANQVVTSFDGESLTCIDAVATQ